MTKFEKRKERACTCVHMLFGGFCGNMPESIPGGRECPILKDPREGYCPFKGFYAFRPKTDAAARGGAV